jgi:hypothetical protein
MAVPNDKGAALLRILGKAAEGRGSPGQFARAMISG